MNISVEEVLSYLKDSSREDIKILPHAYDAIYDFDRNIKEQLLYDCLLKKDVDGILKQKTNRFRLYYKQEGPRMNYDLIIIIEFDRNSTKNIIVVITYETSEKKGALKLNEQSFKMVNEYDTPSDILYLRIVDPYKYQESIELADNIILDFDVNNVPVALEILDASKFFHVKPYALRNFGLDMNIQIKEDEISLNAKFMFLIHHKREEVPVSVGTINDIELPTMQTNYAVATA
jgi:uncharacterized protein YuzE